ncbi:UxaA family hydrolase [Cytobacillus oceanisediminis]|uniref:Altronate dehydratase small subunit n=1 Tax=Cytobacillus oceanisediminis TaxID=665099 RepID=A0A562JRU0_9BACI|nr:UxaA family hydrolase [Cytobacillus oceanisediminis]TWH85876.1 altronate dehydratase small subunit [Cytobacillus oceanisediminis]
MENTINLQKAALVIDRSDNVAVALTDLKKGEECILRFNDREEKVVLLEDIPFGHKVAISNIEKDESVLKYGEEIGKMIVPVQRGAYIHNHNMYCERGLK